MPIHSAHAEVASRAKPASRMAHSPRPPPLARNNHQAPSVMLKPLPKANAAMTKAPCHQLTDKAATIKAEYNKPQGNKAQSTPTKAGALAPKGCAQGRTRRHTFWPKPSSQKGCRPSTNKLSPKANKAT